MGCQKIEVVKGDVPWIIGREWMEEWGLVIDVRRREVRISKTGVQLNCRVDDKGHLREAERTVLEGKRVDKR